MIVPTPKGSRRLGRRLLALLCAVPLLAGAGAAPRSLEVVNQARLAMNQVYVSPVGAGTWGPDRLGDRTLSPGTTLRVELGHGAQCRFDVLIVFEDASREEYRGLDLCGGARLATEARRAVLPADAKPREHTVTITDASPLPIVRIFISPIQAGRWGADRLRRPVAVGAARELTYRGGCLADLRVVFANAAAEERPGIDFCASPDLVIRPGWTTAP
ncbi:MAG: hypothetical protein KGK10_09740 [Rhodospirillales bacterium]|nr:hypothetical protein [Rhodospirillales bacterium]